VKELIDPHQAHWLMLGVLIAAPLIGLLWGVIAKRLTGGLIIGLLVGVGNYALWTVYNAITEHLRLDTVKNLLVNLTLFVIIGIVIGVGAGFFAARQRGSQHAHGGEHGDVAGNRD
jgi:F0F1-type ATP synthase assembly protein I